MPFYNSDLTQQEYLAHLQRHRLFRNIRNRSTFCTRCYPITTLAFHQIPENWPTFWNWLFNRYTPLNYTSYSIFAFSQLDTVVQSGNPAHCVELIQSIEFQHLTIPIEELLYFITYLYVQTNKFQTLPTNQQVATAEQLYHFYLNAEQTEEPQQQQQAQIH
jgi:hypothetical protein